MKKYSSNINIFDDSGDFTRPPSVSPKDLMPLNNNNPNERFQTDILINGKTKYEEENTIIKSLEEEIVSMKHKLSFVYEKDEEIAKLKEQINEFKKEKVGLERLSKDSTELRLTNKHIRDELDLLKLNQTNNGKLEAENHLLREKLKELTNDDEVEELLIEDIENVDNIEELIDVNVPKLRHVLFQRLKDKQSQHIEDLITSYGLRNKNKVKKSVMEKMLEEAIHL